MPLRIKCPHCGIVLTATEESAGERKLCPACGKPFDVPSIQAFAAAAARVTREDVLRSMAPSPVPEAPAAAVVKLHWQQRLGMLSLGAKLVLLVLVLAVPIAGLVIWRTIATRSDPIVSADPAVQESQARQARLDAETQAARTTLLAWFAASAPAEQRGFLETLGRTPTVSASVLAEALRRGEVVNARQAALKLTDRQKHDLLCTLLRWAAEQPLPADTQDVARSYLNQPMFAPVAARLGAYLGLTEAAPVLAGELRETVESYALLTERIRQNHATDALSRELQTALTQQIRDLTNACAALGPSVWPALLTPYWDTWWFMDSRQGEIWWAQLDLVRTHPKADREKMEQAILELHRHGDPSITLAAVVYSKRFVATGFESAIDLSGPAALFLSSKDRTVSQRAVWVICHVTGRRFASFTDSQAPAEVSEAALASARVWANETFVLP